MRKERSTVVAIRRDCRKEGTSFGWSKDASVMHALESKTASMSELQDRVVRRENGHCSGFFTS